MRTAQATYMPFIDKSGENANPKLGWFSRLYVKFVEDGSKVYLEGNSRDPRLKGPKSLFNLLVRISLSQLGFFITGISLFIRPVVQNFGRHMALLRNMPVQ